MNDIARIYRAEILRAVLGGNPHPAKAHDLHRINQIAERLAECEEAQSMLRAKGYGGPGSSIIDAARQVPVNAPQALKKVFEPASHPVPAAFGEWMTYSTDQIAAYFRIPVDMIGGE